jgi:hypothetical protein
MGIPWSGDVDNNWDVFKGAYNADVSDIGSFSDKMNSAKMRANPGCSVLITFFDLVQREEPTGTKYIANDGPDNIGVPKIVNYSIAEDNVVSSSDTLIHCP